MSDNQLKTIPFTTEEGETIQLSVLEQTCIVGQQYLLVTDSELDEEEAQVYIMKQMVSDTVQAQEDTVVYEFVEEEQELESISKVFSELLDDTDIIKQY